MPRYHAPLPLSILDLPPEVLERCVDLSSTPTLLSISLVSRIFNALAIRPLYRDISLHTATALISCCRTLAARPNAASAVRSLSLYYPYVLPFRHCEGVRRLSLIQSILSRSPRSTNSTYLHNFYNLIRDAFHVMAELRFLKISTPDHNLIYALQNCTFPTLEHFECEFTLSLSLIAFLNRHPSISYLQTSSLENLSLSSNHPPPPIVAPSLGYFAGNAQAVQRLAKAPKLRAAFVSWNAIDQQPQLAIQQLQMSSQHLRLLSCRRRGWNLDLFDLISACLPHIVALNMANLLIVDSRPTQVRAMLVSSFVSLKDVP